MKISLNKTVMFQNEILLLAEGKIMKENGNNTHFSSPWLNNSVFLFASRTGFVHIQFLHRTAFISLQPSLPSLCLIWNHICTTDTFLVTDFNSKLFQSGNTCPRIKKYLAGINMTTAY